ncbi:MAG TPA: alpha/beta fold hydrolase [Steroidobacteraceae bacterium]|nr:alpha/beta fold hydrolase [Steroidobacteraceae bacterium]
MPAPAASERWTEIAGLRTLVVGDRATAGCVIVLLHGFQMEPADLAPFAYSIALDAWFVIPEAPLAAQPRGRAWWHIDAQAREAAIARGPRDFATQHPPDLPQARQRLDAFLDALQIESKPLILCGFSQGGMLACDTLLRHPREVAGLALLSASRIAADEQAYARLHGQRVLLTHGREDPDLAFQAGEALRDALVTGGAQVQWLPFDGSHELPLVVWRALRKFVLGLTQF